MQPTTTPDMMPEAHTAVERLRKIAKEHRGPVRGTQTAREFRAACDLATSVARAVAGLDVSEFAKRELTKQADVLDLTVRAIDCPDISSRELLLVWSMADTLLSIAENALAE